MHREGGDDFREGKMPFAKDFGIVFDDADPTANRVFADEISAASGAYIL